MLRAESVKAFVGNRSSAATDKLKWIHKTLLQPTSPFHVTVGTNAPSGLGTLILIVLKFARRAKGIDAVEIRSQACFGHPGCGIWDFTSELQIMFNQNVACFTRTANGGRQHN